MTTTPVIYLAVDWVLPVYPVVNRLVRPAIPDIDDVTCVWVRYLIWVIIPLTGVIVLVVP